MDPLATLKSALADRYRVEREIGAGGMATVYLARDLKHDRNVALKLLSPELGAVLGAERFLSEIRVTANLQHPHLLPLFDSGEVNGLLFYVMPFVQGESLRARLDRERQLGIDEAVRIATAVASALDYAHRQGVIHRDLKPENILLHDGQPLVADFGIALAVSKAGGTRVTQTGLSLGTPQYMSPEQATGDRVIDGRTDIYSLGAVLFEMLTGEAPHTGATAQAIIARVITDKPRSIRESRSTVPEWLDGAVERALAKLPADRWPTAQSFAAALQNRETGFRPAATSVRQRTVWSPKVGVAAGVAAIGLISAGWLARGTTPAPPFSRYGQEIPDSITVEAERGLVVSRDGSLIGFVGRVGAFRTDSANRLWIKSRDGHSFIAVPGVIRPRGFAFSPNGREIVYVQGNRGNNANLLVRVPLTGGTAKQVADSASAGFSMPVWLEDNTIVYQTAGQLRQVADTGGPERIIIEQSRFTSPVALPGDRAVLAIECLQGICDGTRLTAIDLASGQTHALIDDVVRAQYSPTGHLLFLRPNGVLFAAPFDAGNMRLTGEPVPVDSAFATITSTQRPLFSLSETGTLAIWQSIRGRENDPWYGMYWYDRFGNPTPLDSTWRARICCVGLNSASWSIAPNGQRLAITLLDQGVITLFTRRLPDGAPTRLTFHSGESVWQAHAIFTPDGRYVTYRSFGPSQRGWFRIAPSGGQGDSLFSAEQDFMATGSSPDGATIVGHMRRAETGSFDIVAARVGVDSAPRVLLASRFAERSPVLSPDGRWIAYLADETGSNQVYVRPFPDVDRGRWPISQGSDAISPIWSPDSKELFYLDPARREVVAVPVTTTPAFEAGTPRVLFRLPDDAYERHVATVDGKRFLIARQLPSTTPARATLVISGNWLEELRRGIAGR